MNLKQIEAFVKVAEGASFSQAAKELFLTQPTVSAHIAALEKEFDVRLFMRNTKEVRLTEDGQNLYKYAKQMVEIEEQIQELFGEQKDGSKSVLKIAASSVPSQYLLPELLLRYKQSFPETEFKLVETDSAEVMKLVNDRAVDLGFTGTVLKQKNLRYVPFYQDILTIITPNTPKYRSLKDSGDPDISWISQEHFIMREEGSGTRREAERKIREAGVDTEKLDIIACFENQETIKKSVKQGFGITVLSQLTVRDEVDAQELLTFTIPCGERGRDINYVYNKRYYLSKPAERFIHIIKKLYGE